MAETHRSGVGPLTTEETLMIVKLELTVDNDGDGKPEFASTQTWFDCDWSDVTVIQDVLVDALRKLVDAGYQLASNDGLIPEGIDSIKSITRS